MKYYVVYYKKVQYRDCNFTHFYQFLMPTRSKVSIYVHIYTQWLMLTRYMVNHLYFMVIGNLYIPVYCIHYITTIPYS